MLKSQQIEQNNENRISILTPCISFDVEFRTKQVWLNFIFARAFHFCSVSNYFPDIWMQNNTYLTLNILFSVAVKEKLQIASILKGKYISF